MSAPVVSRGTVTIVTERCKGCELCIPACPPQVLQMSSDRNSLGYLYPQLVPGCTGCGACLLVCPDFCFDVYRFELPVEATGDPSVLGRASRSARAGDVRGEVDS